MNAFLLLFSMTWQSATQIPCFPDAERAARTDIVGIAKHPTGGHLLYCEMHEIDKATHSHKVYYANAEKQIFAEKFLNYPENLSTPDSRQTDLRSGEYREVSREGEYWKIVYQENSKSAQRISHVPYADVNVVDAGFTQEIAKRWDAMNVGDQFSVNFAIPVFKDPIGFRIKLMPNEHCRVVQDGARVARCYTADVDNFIVRAFFRGLTLAFDDQRRLLRFEGAVNLRDDREKKQEAIIDYVYPK